jgi:hypothetical protein
MARLSNPPKNILISELPEKDKQRLAFEWQCEHPNETPTTTARIFALKKPATLRKAWERERKRRQMEVAPKHGGYNKILDHDQERALIRYATGHALNGGKGATKMMMYNCAMRFRILQGKEPPSWKWF